MFSTCKKKKWKISKFANAGSNNWDERKGNSQHGVDCQGIMEKENKTLDTERFQNVHTLCFFINVQGLDVCTSFCA